MKHPTCERVCTCTCNMYACIYAAACRTLSPAQPASSFTVSTVLATLPPRSSSRAYRWGGRTTYETERSPNVSRCQTNRTDSSITAKNQPLNTHNTRAIPGPTLFTLAPSTVSQPARQPCGPVGIHRFQAINPPNPPILRTRPLLRSAERRIYPSLLQASLHVPNSSSYLPACQLSQASKRPRQPSGRTSERKSGVFEQHSLPNSVGIAAQRTCTVHTRDARREK